MIKEINWPFRSPSKKLNWGNIAIVILLIAYFIITIGLTIDNYLRLNSLDKYIKNFNINQQVLHNHPNHVAVSLIRKYFGKDTQLFIRIAKAESGLKGSAIGRVDNRDTGLFQVNTYYHPLPLSCLLDMECNTKYAYQLFLKNGTQDWNASYKNWKL